MRYVRCISNGGYEFTLTEGRIYKVLPEDESHGLLRVVDNEGEDYLYDASRFEPVESIGAKLDATETVTVHLDPTLKVIERRIHSLGASRRA